MPAIPFKAKKFPRGVPHDGYASADWAEVAWAAATVGATPLSMGGHWRPLLELQWRALMIRANLVECDSGARWLQSPAYKRLDPSEKSAVSYFLGMTQAKLMCQHLFAVSHLVHLDAVFSTLGLSTSRTRPDFLGVDPATGHYSFALEAKGRSNGLQAGLVKRAKDQVNSLSSAVPTTMRVASVAYFEDGVWRAHLEDPVNPYADLDDRLSTPLLNALYYLPLVGAVVRTGSVTRLTDGRSGAYIPEADLWLSLPRAIIEILTGVVDRPRDRNSLAAAGADLTPTVLQSVKTGRRQVQAPDGIVNKGAEVFRGGDDVQIELGEDWTAPSRTEVAVRDDLSGG